MKLIKYSLFMMASVGTLSAAVTDFTGLTPDSLLTDIPGWNLSEANSSSAPIAFVGLVSGNTTGALGGDLGDISSLSGSAKLTLASSISAPSVSVSLDLLIADSSNSLPTRDIFTFGVSSGAGASIVELSFLPLTGSHTPSADVGQWSLKYTVSGSGPVVTDYVITESMMNSVNILFYGNSVDILMTDDFDTFSVTRSLTGFNTADSSVGALSFGWTKGGAENGDNTMYFDNINVSEAVPEPSSMLLAGCASLLLLKRRRN
jgi:hypothetical protein